MNSATKYLAKSVVITLLDPESMPTSHEEKGTMEWRTESHRFPNFEIRFRGENPEDKTIDRVLRGSDTQPVVIRLNRPNQTYEYTIAQFDENSEEPKGISPPPPRSFRVESCSACYP